MSKPNVIYIYADDLGRGMLSCYGQTHFSTPNIDRIASEGIRFTNFYGCVFCAPARASLLLGLHDCHRGTWTYTTGGIYNRFAKSEITVDQISELIHTTGLQPEPDTIFLPQVFKAAGYATGQIGKLEWGFATTSREIIRHGWDYHYGWYDHARCHGFYPPFLFENGTMVQVPGNTRDDCGVTPEGETPDNQEKRWDMSGKAVYSQDLFDGQILKFIRENRNRPFFLFHPSQLPHGPISIPEIHPSVAGNHELTQYEKEYASMVLRLDHTVGLVLNELEHLGIDDKTMVMFSSDNGHECYYQEEGRCNHWMNVSTGEYYDDIKTKHYSELSGDVFDGNDGMAGKKWTAWEGGPRIPAMIRWPGSIKPGRISDSLIANYDLMPTVADLTDVPSPDGKDGISFLPELLEEPEPASGHEYVVFGSFKGPAIVTRKGWKLRYIKQGRSNIYQLYYLPDDYREAKNLIQEGPEEIINPLSTILLQACDGNYRNGMATTHLVSFPGWQYYGRDCDMLF